MAKSCISTISNRGISGTLSKQFKDLVLIGSWKISNQNKIEIAVSFPLQNRVFSLPE